METTIKLSANKYHRLNKTFRESIDVHFVFIEVQAVTF